MKKYKTHILIFATLLISSIVLSLVTNFQGIVNLSNPPPNVVFIMADDMDLALLPYMKYTNKLIAKEGAIFTNYFVTSSACCPSRASILRGQYPHNTKILENSPGFEKFYKDGTVRNTLSLWINSAGYSTSYLGKYMNLYPAGAPRIYIPPGWTDWHVFLGTKSTDFYYKYTASENGELINYANSQEDYSTDMLGVKAIEFINKNYQTQTPFFLFFSVYAPHGPSIPADRHKNMFLNITYPQKGSFHEEDISDKPLIIQNIVNSGGFFEVWDANDLFIRRVQTMQAVDEWVSTIVKTLEQNGQLENTYIIFTSDNGFHMGEHQLPSGKMLPYEEDIKVPLLIRGPGIEAGTVISKIVLNIDIAPTLASLTRSKPANFIDGRSFAELLLSPQINDLQWRKAFLIETGDTTKESPVIAYQGVRTEAFIYVEYENGELEFYDLINDPYQMNNIANQLSAETIKILHQWVEEFKLCAKEVCRNLEMEIPQGIKY